MTETIDPLFYILFAARFDATSIEAQPSSPCPNPYQAAYSTYFEMAVKSGGIESDFDVSSPLLKISVPHQNNTTVDFIVCQFDGGLISGSFTKTSTLDTLAGVFVSCDDIFTLDALSEIFAASQLAIAQIKIVDKVADILSPILSGETGFLLGKALGIKLTDKTAKRFADPFINNLYLHAVKKNY